MRVMSAVVVLRRLSKMADYRTLAILMRLFKLLVFMLRRSSAISRIKRNRRLRAAARRRVRSYLQMRRRMNVTALANTKDGPFARASIKILLYSLVTPKVEQRKHFLIVPERSTNYFIIFHNGLSLSVAYHAGIWRPSL